MIYKRRWKEKIVVLYGKVTFSRFEKSQQPNASKVGIYKP